MTAPAAAPQAAALGEAIERIATNVEQVILGKPEVVRQLVLCLLAEGHVLVEDVPGVGKTTLAKALARSIDTTFGRIQFTPDLMPTDVVGVSVWDRSAGSFVLHRGPIFAGIVLADEINRASPKTQSALLEAMAERHVTIDGETHHLGRPFLVLATQNPVEHQGTFPLPESQLDRFLMRVSIGYPGREAERQMLDQRDGEADAAADVQPVTTAAEVRALASALGQVHVAPALQGYLVDVAEATRRHPLVALGMSPRATLNLQRVARARAASLGRHFVTPDDIKALAAPVLAHRLVLSREAEVQGATGADALEDVLRAVPVPTART
ncbi:ATPase [cyanobacterium TDX16]|nr:ATPase [cyanobacterium TDX16]